MLHTLRAPVPPPRHRKRVDIFPSCTYVAVALWLSALEPRRPGDIADPTGRRVEPLTARGRAPHCGACLEGKKPGGPPEPPPRERALPLGETVTT
jgi:hypothetical protein